MRKVRAITSLCAAIAVSSSLAQAPAIAGEPVGIMDNPCPPPLQPPPELAALQKAGPKAVFESKLPAVVTFLREEDRRRGVDRAGLCRYRLADQDFASQVKARPIAVFIGDSITDLWPGLDSRFFDLGRFAGRGIGAQVSGQGVLRFQQDVVELHPKSVHILYGTNDIAGLAGPTTLKRIEDNLTVMVELARANNIAPVLGTILPITALPDGTKDQALDANIVKLNAWIRAYGKRDHVIVADYYPVLSDGAGGFRSRLNSDGVHPNAAGYRLMEPIASAAIRDALRPIGTRHSKTAPAARRARAKPAGNT